VPGPDPDDKVQAVVALVLQAVDQRLIAVREQIALLANTVARNHADVNDQIAGLRSAHVSLDAGAPNDAAVQLMTIANLLADRVASFETRVNEYTDLKVAELDAAITATVTAAVTAPPAPAREPAPAPSAERAVVAATETPPVAAAAPPLVAAAASPLVAAAEPLMPLMPLMPRVTLAPLHTLVPAARPVRRKNDRAPVERAVESLPLAAEPAGSVAVATAGPVFAAPSIDPPVGASTPDAAQIAIDIEQLSAAMSERLSAAIDRALAI
jgi:hypothetical protein